MTLDGLVYAYLFDGSGGGKKLNAKEVERWKPEDGLTWLHFQYTDEAAKQWILESSGLSEVCAEALVTEETRPRCTVIGGGVLLALRGVNLNPGSDPEDMVSIRLYVDETRIISTRKRQLLSVTNLVKSIEENNGPCNSGEFITLLAAGLTEVMQGTIDDLEERAGLFEEEAIASSNYRLRNELLAIRRETIILRRYLSPQREALSRLYTEKISWLSDNDRITLREVTDKLIRHIEDLDAVRDRAAVAHEELANQLSEQMNKRMYVLSLVAAIFLPLGFLTGLLGINVAGIPGAENGSAFFIFSFTLIAIVVVQIIIFRWKRWI